MSRFLDKIAVAGGVECAFVSGAWGWITGEAITEFEREIRENHEVLGEIAEDIACVKVKATWIPDEYENGLVINAGYWDFDVLSTEKIEEGAL